MCCKLAWICLLMVGILPLAWAGEVEVISTNDYGMTLEFTLPAFTIEEVWTADGWYQRIEVKGWGRTTEMGYPDLPVTGGLVQVPESGEMDVRVLASTTEVLPGFRICPVPVLKLSDQGEVVSEFVRDESVYHSPAFIPDLPVEISERSIVRGVCVARILLHPFQWNPATGELRYLRKLAFRVSFAMPLTPTSTAMGGAESVYEDILGRSLIGYRPGCQVRPAARPESDHEKLGQKALRIEVKKEGLYRITGQDMMNAGMDLSGIDPSTFQMFMHGQEAAVKVMVQSGYGFGPADSIEFYSRALNNTFSDTMVLWLYWGEALGKRILRTNGSVTGSGKSVDAFSDRLHFEQNKFNWANAPEAPEKDYWFWQRIIAPNTGNFALDVPSPAGGQEDATLLVGFHGLTEVPQFPDHHTLVYLNGTMIGESYWDGAVEHSQQCIVPPGVLAEGINNLLISLPGDTGAPIESVLINWIEVVYSRRFTAVGDRLKFTVKGPGRKQVTIRGITVSDVVVYDITDTYNAREVVGFSVKAEGPNYVATFEDEIAQARTYYLTTRGGIGTPPTMELWTFAGLKNPNLRADYVVITKRAFLSTVEPLRKYRENQGLLAMSVGFEDICAEFNHGLIAPEAIRQFLQYAYENWRPPAPTYVLFVGDATVDYRNYLGGARQSVVPAHLSQTYGFHMTPDDGWYACVHGTDPLPDMLIGRLPGNSPQTIGRVVDKVIRFERREDYAWSRALLVADNDSGEFEQLSEDLISYVPPQLAVARVYLRLYPSVDAARQDIIACINTGAYIANYNGHASLTAWGGEGVFRSEDVASLANSDLTFMTAFTCLCAYFADPFKPSLAEEFVAAEDKGAVGCFSVSGLAYQWENVLMGRAVFSEIFGQQNRLVGSVAARAELLAYASASSEDTIKKFHLCADPATRLPKITR